MLENCEIDKLISKIELIDPNGKVRIVDRRRAIIWIKQLVDKGIVFSKYDQDYNQIKHETGIYLREIEEIFKLLSVEA